MFCGNNRKSKTYPVTASANNQGRRAYCVITNMYGNTIPTDTIGSYVADNGFLQLMVLA